MLSAGLPISMDLVGHGMGARLRQLARCLAMRLSCAQGSLPEDWKTSSQLKHRTSLLVCCVCKYVMQDIYIYISLYIFIAVDV